MSYMKKIIRISLVVLIAFATLTPALSAMGYWREDWVETEVRYIPIIYYRVYDPAGTNSYQEVTETVSTALSLKLEAEAGGNKATSTTTVSSSLSTGVRTVDYNDPSINGIGKGDVISGSEIKYTVEIEGYTIITPRSMYHPRSRLEAAKSSAMLPAADYLLNEGGLVNTVSRDPQSQME